MDVAWSLLKALPEQREMADSGQITPSPYMGPKQYEDVDMGTIHPGALSAMRRLQVDNSNRELDTRSYNSNVGYHGYSPPPGRLIGTASDRDLTRSGPSMPDEGSFYNPETRQMEDRPEPSSERGRAAQYQKWLSQQEQ